MFCMKKKNFYSLDSQTFQILVELISSSQA